MYIIGIDPGKTGGVAHIQDGRLVKVDSFSGSIENCRRIGINNAVFAPTYFIERVTASPHMGVVSAFTFGRWAEAVECAVILSGNDLHIIRPQVWQNAIGVFSGGDKQRLYDHAKRIYPSEHETKMFNKATSDAVLIAHYVWRCMSIKGGE